MTQIFDIQDENPLYAPQHYPTSTAQARDMQLGGRQKSELRALTIAAFRIAQNNTQLSERGMDPKLLKCLTADSRSAIPYWEAQGRLRYDEKSGRYHLTRPGITECQSALVGLLKNGYDTTELQVQEWIARMRFGAPAATKPDPRSFDRSAWDAE